MEQMEYSDQHKISLKVQRSLSLLNPIIVPTTTPFKIVAEKLVHTFCVERLSHNILSYTRNNFISLFSLKNKNYAK